MAKVQKRIADRVCLRSVGLHVHLGGYVCYYVGHMFLFETMSYEGDFKFGSNA